MSKKLKNLNWESVALEGFPASVTNNLQGFVGLEECSDYGFEKDTKRPIIKKKQHSKKRKNPAEDDTPIKINNKKVKSENGFFIESCVNVTPSVTSKQHKENNINIQNINGSNKPGNKNKKEMKNVQLPKKANKLKLGEDIGECDSGLTPEDMLTWAEFKLPEPITKALMELGFKKPTKIQQLTLPAAIHGRRDILGAAETGSGKTLAFGLPILSGILKLKEKAQLKNLDVYDIPYKKSSVKKKNNEPIELKKSNVKGKKKVLRRNKSEIDSKASNKVQATESSEDGYSSDDETVNSDGKEDVDYCSDDETVSSDGKEDVDYSSDDETVNSDGKEDVDYSSDDETVNSDVKEDVDPGENDIEDSAIDDEEYLKEVEVPLRKKVVSADEGNDSDDSENYIHLSDMLDSDDLAESDKSGGSGEEGVIQELPGGDNDDDDEETYDAESEAGEELDGSNIPVKGDGVGLVKVVEDVEIPGQAIVKTGKPLYALIVTPTRELAIQISRHLIAAAKYTGIKIATIVGGMAAVKQERVLKHGPEVVVATPGRLWELVNQGQPHLQQLASVKFLAIDETDRMVERGHFEELYPLLERLNADDERRSSRQNFVFSATLTLVHDLPTHMKGKKVTKNGKIINRKIQKMTPQQKVDRLIKIIGMTDPKVVDITTSLGTAETLTECRITCSLEHKDAYLYYILKRHPGRTIVFCNSIGNVKRLAQLLTLLKCNPLPLHANMQQRQRLKNLERFRDDPHGVLISTDVAARGLDIPNVDHVVHYQVPRTAENYVHRSGRTARANKEGLTILMMEPSEAYLYSKICRTLNKTSELETFPVASQSLTPLIELVQVARGLDALHCKQRRAAQAVGWREKAAREMDIIVDDDDLPVKKVDPAIEKALRVKRRQLDSLLTRPIYPRGFSFKYPTLNDPAAFKIPEEKALEVMKKAIESGELKKQKRKSKNEPLLKLEKVIKAKNKPKYKKRNK